MADQKTPKIHLKSGRLFPRHADGECSNCLRKLPVGTRTLLLDLRVRTEDGLTPVIKDVNVHEHWLFCSSSCLIEFADRLRAFGDEIFMDEGDTPPPVE